MGFFNFFRQPDINQGVADYQRTPGAVLLDVRTPQEYRGGDIYPEAKMFRCKPLTKWSL